MGEHTEIGWTDHTFNPWHGCTKVSPACDNCYAAAFSKRTGRVEWGDDAERWFPSEAYWQHPAKWNAKARAEGVRHRVFCASMADVFEDRTELQPHRDRLWALIADTPWLDWQLLTKRPENVTAMVPASWLSRDPTAPIRDSFGSLVATGDTTNWPVNAWVGVTVEDERSASERVPILRAIPACTRFLSCEPLLGHLAPRRIDLLGVVDVADWVIVGGESGPGHRPLNLHAAREIRDACDFLSIPFFFKQLGGATPKAGGKLLDGREHCEFPA